MSITVVTRSTTIEALFADGRLAGLVASGDRLVLLDAAYYGLPEGGEARRMLDDGGGDVVVHATGAGSAERMRRLEGGGAVPGTEADAEREFLHAGDGVAAYLADGRPVTVVMAPDDARSFNMPTDLRLVGPAEFEGPEPAPVPGF